MQNNKNKTTFTHPSLLRRVARCGGDDTRCAVFSGNAMRQSADHWPWISFPPPFLESQGLMP
jgi:hypothetical protein